jgi:hypothetical protein
MRNPFLLTALAVTLSQGAAWAQDAATSATEAPAPSAAAPTPGDLAERVTTISERADGLDERTATLESDVKGLKKVKISGYIQGRYEAKQNGFNGIDDQKSGDFKTGSGKPGSPDTFYIRRARVKFQFQANDWSTFVLQPDFAKGSVTLKDGYADLNEQWTGTQVVRFGQFNVPYGYEIEQSSSVRELPERSRWERTVFAGERDRGAALYGKVKMARYALAVLNGNGTEDKDGNFKGVDNNFGKQYVGRAGVDMGWLVAGVSGSVNTKLIPATKQVKTTQTKDANFNGTLEPSEINAAKPQPGNPNKQYKEQAAGAYVMFFQDVPYLGGFSLKGEYNRGWTGVFADEFGETKAGALKHERRAKMLGWHVVLSQFIGDANQLAYRIDQFDPDLESRDKECHSKKHFATDYCHFGRVTTHAAAWNYFWDANVRLTTAIESPKMTAWKDKRDMTFTEQVQYKF